MSKLSRPVPIVNITVLLAMAALILVAISPWNAWNEGRIPDYYGWNLFSYFTILSNLIAAGVFITAAVLIIRKKPVGDWFRLVRGGAVLYMLVTGIVYTVLLKDNVDANAALAFDWKNFILHQFGPIFIVSWWLLWPSAKPISSREAWWWLVFPVAWVIYTFIRASFTGWYPYPFLNPELVGGWGGVAVYVIGITAFFVILAQLLAWISRRRNDNKTLY